MKIKWLDKPQKHDYPAAESYLSLTLDACGGQGRRRAIEKSRDVGVCGERHFQSFQTVAAWGQQQPRGKRQSEDRPGEKLSPLLLFRDRTGVSWLSPTAIIDFARSIRLMKML